MKFAEHIHSNIINVCVNKLFRISDTMERNGSVTNISPISDGFGNARRRSSKTRRDPTIFSHLWPVRLQKKARETADTSRGKILLNIQFSKKKKFNKCCSYKFVFSLEKTTMFLNIIWSSFFSRCLWTRQRPNFV